jgi:hypothetical protein
MHELNDAHKALLKWFTERPKEIVSHSDLEYGRVADECFRREGVEPPVNPGRTARDLRRAGYLCTGLRGTFHFDPDHDVEVAKIEWMRQQVKREIAGLMRRIVNLQELLMAPNVVDAKEKVRIGALIASIKELLSAEDLKVEVSKLDD